MRNDQLVRTAAAVVIAVGYAARLATVGNGPVSAFGFEASPFALFLLAEVTIALPEITDRLPWGPTRGT
jgi:hypothetical protein